MYAWILLRNCLSLLSCQTYCVVCLNEWIVDSNNVDVIVLNAVICSVRALFTSGGGCIRIAEDDTSNAAETVDTDLWHSVSVAPQICE